MENLENIVERFTYEDHMQVLKTMTEEEKNFDKTRLEMEKKYYKDVQRFFLKYIENENELSKNPNITPKM